MTEIFVGWFLFAGVMVIAAVVFTGWIIARVVRGLGRTLGLLPPKAAQRRREGPKRFGLLRFACNNQDTVL